MNALKGFFRDKKGRQTKLPERFKVSGVVTRSAVTGKNIEEKFGVPTYRSIAELLDAKK